MEVIIGLVNANGSGGFQRSDQWYFVVSLAAWRFESCPLVEEELRCEWPIEHERLEGLMKTFGPYSVIKLKASLNAEKTLATASEGAVFSDSDSEISEVSHRLQQPIYRQHELIGQLKYERAYSSYEGSYSHLGKTVRISITASEPNHYDDQFSDATALLQSLSDWDDRAQRKAAEDLLELANDWREQEAKLSKDDFIARLSLDLVVIEGNGAFSLWFNDGNLFGGHGVSAGGTLQEGLQYADMS